MERVFEYETLVNDAYGYAKVRIHKNFNARPFKHTSYYIYWLTNKEDSEYKELSLGSHDPDQVVAFLIGVLYGLDKSLD